MRFILAALLFLASYSSYSQVWALGDTQEDIINEYKSSNYYIDKIDEATITFRHNKNKKAISFIFEKGLCVSTFWECTEEVKNYFVSKYVREEYNVRVKKVTENGSDIVWIIFQNDFYEIQILDGYMDTSKPNPDFDLFIIVTSRLGHLK